MKSHFAALVVYALVAGAGFSIFMREGVRDRVRFALLLAFSMIGIAVAAGWLMRLAG